MEKNNQTTTTAEPGKKELIITREFNSPRELVWKAWTEPAMIKKWWGPKGYTCPSCEVDFKTGGKYFFCMRSPEGKDFWSTGIYKEIAPMERIVFTDSFADEKGNVVPATHYGMEGFPLELMVTVTFEDHNGNTKMTLKHIGIPTGEITDMTNVGWNESFDKLDESIK
ncbi:SRPBCC family protein [Flavobacterium sp.]|uniref:SRPBCC family protein n=1 Tax=Flavobacterium sp. TaxID=239 RepID=UPI002B4AD4DF|nr:SRPBCC domain-containing protein [Flavobacterium sp.]HLF53428.1 SRPBCC domain-containing protein [Flavobacterium sp.]